MKRWIGPIVVWLLAALAVTFAVVLAPAGEAGAAPSPECLAHLERVGVTEKQDQRYWLERGQLPRKCPLREDASEPSKDRKTEARKDDRKDEDRDKKSRFCRKRWWC